MKHAQREKHPHVVKELKIQALNFPRKYRQRIRDTKYPSQR